MHVVNCKFNPFPSSTTGHVCVCVVQAAETEDLRKEWVGYLWQAMHLSAPTTSVSEDAQ